MNKTKNRPDNWNLLPINLACNVNPRIIRNNSQNNLDVSFIPMAAVDEEFGEIKKLEKRKFQDVSKGFTYFEENDVLFAKITPCMENGKIAIARNLENRIGFGSTEFHVLQCSESILPDYLFYFIRQKSFRRYAESFFSGSAGQQRVPSDFFRRVSIPLPPLAEQKQIVAILQEADALRRKKKEILEKSNRLAGALFLEMFGDHNQKKEEVKTVKLKDITLRITDGVHQKPDYTQEGVPFISVKDITTRKLIFDDCKYISFSDYEKFTKRTKPERGDILYTKVGATYGRAALIDTDKEFSIYVSVCLIKPNHSLVDSVFLKNILNLPIIKKQADARIRGIGVPDLHLDQIQEFKFPLPPRHLQNDFAKKVEAIEDTTKQIESSLQKMEKLYNSLLQKAFTGDLRERKCHSELVELSP